MHPLFPHSFSLTHTHSLSLSLSHTHTHLALVAQGLHAFYLIERARAGYLIIRLSQCHTRAHSFLVLSHSHTRTLSLSHTHTHAHTPCTCRARPAWIPLYSGVQAAAAWFIAQLLRYQYLHLFTSKASKLSTYMFHAACIPEKSSSGDSKFSAAPAAGARSSLCVLTQN
jgi:hypothetical protein